MDYDAPYQRYQQYADLIHNPPTVQMLPYETAFKDLIIENDFYEHYLRELNSLFAYFQNNQVSMTGVQEKPFEDILDLI